MSRTAAVIGVAVAAAAAALSGCVQSGAATGTSSTSRSGSTTTTTTPATTAPVTSTQMEAIVAATMTSNNKANETLDLNLLEGYESGSSLAIDAASYRESAQLPSSACSYPPFGISVVQAVAEAGSSYPQRFIVLGSSYSLRQPKGCSAPSGSCPHADSIFEYERSAAGKPWTIALEPSADSGDIVHLAANGSAAAPLTSAETAAATSLPAAVVTDLEGYETSGSLGPLKAGYFTGACWLIPDPRGAFEQYRKSGVASHQVYAPASDQVSVPTAAGGAFTMFTLDFETTLVPSASGGTIDWISDPQAEPVTGLLAGGQYKRIVEHGALEIAAETGSDGKFTIVGAYGGITSVSGTVGSPGPGSTTSGGVLVSYGARGAPPEGASRGSQLGRTFSKASISPRCWSVTPMSSKPASKR